MPLDFWGLENIELALSPRNESSYRDDTVLTLEVAHSNARLIAKPASEWLTSST
jgi:hypothetical protein